MTTTTWTKAPADLLGRGSAAARPDTGIEIAVRVPVTPLRGTGLPFGGTAVRMRPEVRQADAAALVNAQIEPGTTASTHNYIAVSNDGTPLGIHPSGRPQS
jgi:hypothetical protein